MKTIITAFLLVSLLPWCGFSAAWAATSDIGGDVYLSDETAILQVADVAEAKFVAPLKNKRIAVLRQAHCTAIAPLVSGTDEMLFLLRNQQLVFGHHNFVPRYAQAPPTSPPRSV